MGPLNIVLWVGGVLLLWLGYARARGPWARYQDLKAQDANVARYEAWRGGIREDSGPTGASVAMAILRRQAQIGVGLGIIGVIAIVSGFVIR
jgi:uncharacterized membrane protein